MSNNPGGYMAGEGLKIVQAISREYQRLTAVPVSDGYSLTDMEYGSDSVVLLDTETGKRVIVSGHSPYEWGQGYLSCDCERSMYFGAEVDDQVHQHKASSNCCGTKRFLIIESANHQCEHGIVYSLFDLNANYDKAHLKEWLVKK